MIQDMTERLKEIYLKTKSLVDQNKQLKANNESLKSELGLLKQTLHDRNKEMEELISKKENLENKLNFYTLAPESLNKREIKDKIDQYISEIDLCIKQLENI